MENAVEALKIAGAVLMFVLALTLSISSLSQANQSVSSITNMYDKEAQYEYVKPSNDLDRIVGIETIVPTMYVAYEENIKIIFKDKNGNALPIYYKTNQYGSRVDSTGKAVNNASTDAVTINCIDLAEEAFDADPKSASNHLSMILDGKNRWKQQYKDDSEMLGMLDKGRYGNQFIYNDGFYDYLANHTFTENLGEYYQGSTDTDNNQTSSSNATKIKKRIIIYQEI